MKILFYFSLLAALMACGDEDSGNSAPFPPVPNPENPAPDGKFSISGKLITPDYIQSDRDVNDPNSENRPNNSFSTAQPLLNPVSVSGYVNNPFQGSPGSSAISGDISDFYRVNLLAGQAISLVIPHHDRGDMDLYIYPASCTDSTCGSNRCQQNGDPTGNNGSSFQYAGANEKITVPADGAYFIEVCVYSGYGTYTLSIGTKPGQAIFSAEDDFVPGEMIASFKPSIKAADIQSGNSKTRNMKKRPVLLKMDNGSGSLSVMSGSTLANMGNIRINSRHSSKRETAAALGQEYLEKWDTLNAIAELNLRRDIQYAEPNYIIRSLLVPNDEFYPYQWHYPIIDLPGAWDITTGSSDIVVAVVDSGIAPGLKDLQGQLVEGYDFVQDITISGDGDGLDSDPTDPGSDRPGSAVYHGTHVAGTIAAKSNNNSGIAGVAWQARVMPVRALGTDGSGTAYDLMQAVRYAAGLPNDSSTVPQKKADIINMSLGGPGYMQAGQDLATEVYNAGVVMVAAAGNTGQEESGYPASYRHVISVSAVDINKKIAPYSTYGADVDIAAPGGNMLADQNADGYADGVLSLGYDKQKKESLFPFYEGTSMAAPHVAGVFALMKAVNPELKPADFDSLLASGKLTEDIGDAGRDNLYGFGLVNALKAVRSARNPGEIPAPPANPSLTVTPAQLNFKLTESILFLNLSAASGGVRITSVTATEPYISIAPQNVNSNGLGDYRISLERNGVPAGIHSTDITISSNTGTVSVPVIFQATRAGEEGIKPEAGYLYVTLFDPETMLGKHQLQLGPDSDGTYAFNFTDIPTGSYLLIAGSDFNNNGAICDFSESCGVYPRRDAGNMTIDLTQDLTDINFMVDYEIGFRENGISATTAGTGQLPFTPHRLQK